MNHFQILDYRPDLQHHFERINKQWINEFFELEEFDKLQLENPDANIISKGGAIIFAQDNSQIIGTVALSKVEEGVYEMIKMGVSPEARGKKIGLFLGQQILEKAKAMGAHKVILYSNTKLGPALSLYRKLGFREATKECGKYGRCDVKMEIEL
jgi:N-acetylglutamate synthase-like GNAT family acetyltransferase